MEYTKIIDLRTFMPFTDLKSLCRDIPIPIVKNSEISFSNEFYGMATVLKNYAGLPSQYSLKATCTHGGPLVGIWDNDRKLLPSCFVWGESTKKAFEEVTSKKIFVIGAPFFYAKDHYSAEHIKQEKTRLGHNALVFHNHSTHHSLAKNDENKLLENLDQLKKQFDTVRICVYWKDFLQGGMELYLNAGFECVTAGHIFDPNFLSRLKSLIKISDHTFACELGSSLGFSVGLNIPHTIWNKNELELTPPLPSNITASKVLTEESSRLVEAFSVYRKSISHKQKQLCDNLWGMSALKNPDELCDVISQAEHIYQSAGSKKNQESKEPNFVTNKQQITSLLKDVCPPIVWRYLSKIKKYL